MAAPDLGELATLTRTQDTVATGYVNQAQTMARQSVQEITDWYDHAQITRWATDLAERIQTYMGIMAESADAYIAKQVEMITGKVFDPAGAIPTGDGVRRGVTHPGVYGRVADKFRYWQAQWDKQMAALPGGGELPSARPTDLLLTRLDQTAQTDLLLTGRNQAQRTLIKAADDGLITGYRRVLHPELTTEGDCGLCIAASTRIYHVEHLLPMHPGCHCTPMGITEDHDPGGAINDADLARFYRDAGAGRTGGYANNAENLRKTRYRIDEHGEFGPVLAPEDQPIRTEKKVRRDSNYPTGWTEEREARLNELENQDRAIDAEITRLAQENANHWGPLDEKTRANNRRMQRLLVQQRRLEQEIGNLQTEKRSLAKRQATRSESPTDTARKIKLLQDKRDALEKAYFAGNPNDDRLNTDDYPWERWHEDIRNRIDVLDHEIADLSGDPLGGNLNGYPRIIGPHSIADDAGHANPFWPGHNSYDQSYTINCAHCVNTQELRRRGYRVMAAPMPSEEHGRTMDEILDPWRTQDGAMAILRTRDILGEKDLRSYIEGLPDGARGTVQINFFLNGHVFSFEKDRDGVHFVEPQEGFELTDAEFQEYLNNSTKRFTVIRMDDLRPSRVDPQEFLSVTSDDSHVNEGAFEHSRKLAEEDRLRNTPEEAHQRIEKECTWFAQDAVDTLPPGPPRDEWVIKLRVYKRAQTMSPAAIEEQYHDAMGRYVDADRAGDKYARYEAFVEGNAWKNALWEGWRISPGVGNSQGVPDVVRGVTLTPDFRSIIQEQGGFTYNPLTHGLLEVGKDRGFAVAQPGTEHIVGNDTISREQFETAIADLAEQNRDKIEAGAMLGGWYSPDRKVYMVELTDIVPDHDEAVRLGVERNQEAIFDLSTGDTIGTGGTGDAVRLTGVPVDLHTQATATAHTIIADATRVEPSVTPALERIAAANGAHMEGLSHRLKTEESLTDKLERKSITKKMTVQEYGSTVADALRYTMIVPSDHYSQAAQQTLDDFRRRGFELVDVSNTWYPGSSYMGLNTNLRTPDGFVFELQFHTPQSWDVKDRQHKDYEIERNLNLSPEERAAATQRMLDNAKAMVIPPGAGQVGTTPRGPLAFSTYDALSPALQTKIEHKLEQSTHLSIAELTTRVHDNLLTLYRGGDQAEADWYRREGADLATRAQALGITPERFTGMVAVTSARKRWVDNKDFAQAIAQKLRDDQSFPVTQDMIADYNAWAARRRGGSALPHPDLLPGTYRPSELPADFVASKVPGMPKHLNADYVIAACRIYRGEQTLDEAIGGPKQRSFVNNLLAPDDDRFVTVDTWHYRAAMRDITVEKKVGQKTYNYTLEQWTDRDLSVTDGRAEFYGYDPKKDRYDHANVVATIRAADTFSPQVFFQSGPQSGADNWDSKYGTYPWFVKQTQIVAQELGTTPNAVQAVIWYAIGGGQR